MKRLIGVIAMLMIFTFAISGCKDNTKVGEEKPIEDKPVVNIQNQETNLPLNENFDLEKSMESIFEAVENETRELTEEEVNEKYNFVVITLNEWEKYKNEYIENIQNGKKYNLIDYETSIIEETIVDKEPTIVDKLFELVGEESIEFK